MKKKNKDRDYKESIQFCQEGLQQKLFCLLQQKMKRYESKRKKRLMLDLINYEK